MRGEHLRRVEYQITDEGRAELRDWAGTAHRPQEDRDAFLLQAIFLDLVPDEQILPILEEYARNQRRIEQESEDHSGMLEAGLTPLMQERLSRRPDSEHERIKALKARAFAGKAKVARARAEWAEEYIELLSG